MLRRCVLLFSSLLLAAACSDSSAAGDEAAANDEEVRARAQWNVNDVSFLFPHPEKGQGPLLLGMKPSADKTLLPEAVFKLLGDQASGFPFLIEVPGRDKLYPKMRVTAVRVDPCFDSHDPASEPAGKCVRQI